jgi:hypothetical protein
MSRVQLTVRQTLRSGCIFDRIDDSEHNEKTVVVSRENSLQSRRHNIKIAGVGAPAIIKIY